MDLVTLEQTRSAAVTHEQVRLALRYLLGSKDAMKAYWKHRDTHECVLEEHPFGLETKMVRLSDGWGENGSRLIADPDGTDVSVDAMKLMLMHEAMACPSWGGQVPFRLRIIRAQHAEDWYNPGKYVHFVFFELITGVGAFMCGGCTDCSGEGGRGREELEAIFQFVAALYEISVEEAVIPLAVAGPARQKLNRAYTDFEKRRSQVAA